MNRRNSTANVGADAYEQPGGGGGGGVTSIQPGLGIAVNSTNPASPIVSTDLAAQAGIQLNAMGPNTLGIGVNLQQGPGIALEVLPLNLVQISATGGAGSSAARAFPFDPLQAAYLEIAEVTPPAGNEFAIEFSILIYGLGGSPLLVRYHGVSKQGVTGGSKFLFDGGYTPPLMLANGLAIQEMPIAGGKIKFLLQNFNNQSYPGAFASVLEGFVSVGASAQWLTTPVILGAPLPRDTAFLAVKVYAIQAGSGISVNNTDPTKPIVTATGGGVITSDAGGITMPSATCRNAAGVPGVNNGGALLATIRTPDNSIRVSRLSCGVKQAGSGLVTLGVYSVAGALLARTAPFAPSVVGFAVAPIAFNGAGVAITSIDLMGGDPYYFAIHATQAANGAQFYGTDAATTFGPTPWIAWGKDNIATMPATLTGGSENSQRFLVQFLTAT